MEKAKIVFYPNEVKTSIKSSLIPIYIRISKNGRKTEAKLDVSLTQAELPNWNSFNQRLDLKGNTVNKRLEEIDFDFKGLEYRFKNEFHTFSTIEIKEKLFGNQFQKDPHSIEVIAYAEDYYTNTVLTNKNISTGTKKNYRKAINHLTNFLSYSNQSRLTLKQFTSLMAFAFYDYLQKDIYSSKNLKIKEGIKDYSASSIVVKIIVIFSRAVDTDLIQKNPFKNLRLQRKYPKKPHLQISEIRSLMQLDLTQEIKLEIHRDIFLFGIFTGLSYADIYALKRNEITIEQNEFLYSTNREKTNEQIKQLLVAQAVRLVKKYQTHDETIPENRVFPKRHLNNVNDALKLIQVKAGITKNLTTHIARHTANQMLNDIGCINADVINSMLGWSNGKQGMRMNYKSISFDILLYAKERFEEFLNKHLMY